MNIRTGAELMAKAHEQLAREMAEKAERETDLERRRRLREAAADHARAALAERQSFLDD